MQSTRRGFLKTTIGSLGAAGLGTAAIERTASAEAPTTEKYQLSCQTLPYRGLPLRRALEGISRAGYKYVMIFQSHEDKPAFTPALSATERADLKKLVRDHGLTLHMSFIGLSVNLGTEGGRSQYKRELDLFREFDIKTVIGVGPAYYLTFPSQPKPADQWAADVEQFCSNLEKVVPHAADLGITITLKPHADVSRTAKDAMKVIRRINSDNLKACWDGGNVSFYEGIHPDPDFPALAPHVRSVCIKDHLGKQAEGNFPVPGQGQVDFDLMFKILFGAGFRGPLAVERVDGTMNAAKMEADLIDQRIRQAHDYIKPLLDKHARA